MHQAPEASLEWKKGSLVQLQTKCGIWDQEVVGSKFTLLCISPQGHPGPMHWDLLRVGRGHQKQLKWPDFSQHSHSPPLQSITMEQKGHITIKFQLQVSTCCDTPA